MTAMVIDNISHKVSQITMKDGTLVYNGLRLEVISILCSASSVMLQPAEALQELQSPGVICTFCRGVAACGLQRMLRYT